MFRFLEIWENEEAMMAQFAAPHFGAFQAAVGELGMAGMDGKKYEISSVGRCSDSNPITNLDVPLATL